MTVGTPKTERAPALRVAGRFVLWFCCGLLVGQFLLALRPVERGFAEPWVALDTRLSAVLLSWSGVEAHADPAGRLVSAAGPQLDIQRGCDGLDALVILVAAMLAFPAGWRLKVAGVLGGALAVFLINAVRIASLMLIAVHWPERLDFFHIDVWQPAMMLISFALFAAWGLLARRGGQAVSPVKLRAAP